MKATRLLFFIALIFLAGCRKERQVVYEVQEQEIYQNSSEKKNLKSTTQFISIAYNDLFGTNITNAELNKFDIAYQAFGDKYILEDMIVKSLVNRQGAQVPTDQQMRNDITTFVEGAYLRFYNRKPNEFETWKMKDLIEKNTDITAKSVYYSLMTSEEYRYF
jgi:uncharacterized protein YcfL